MTERIAGEVECHACEGTKAVVRLALPDGWELVVDCPLVRFEERAQAARGRLRELVPYGQRYRARQEFETFLEHATYNGTACPTCDGQGWELRLIQVGPGGPLELGV